MTRKTKKSHATAPKIVVPRAPELVTGVFTKKEAAGLVVQGQHHVHSCALGDRDPGAEVTRALLAGEEPRFYPWERFREAKVVRVGSSAERHDVIRHIAGELGSGSRRDLREKVTSVLEELVSNAVYHAYIGADGKSRYPRQKPAHLTKAEKVDVRYCATDTGVYLSVTDHGGRLGFDQLTSSFQRCYGATDRQIEDKESGAGLGIYMVFEIATHMKVATVWGSRTEIACWIADKRHFDPGTFSFNFFEWR